MTTEDKFLLRQGLESGKPKDVYISNDGDVIIRYFSLKACQIVEEFPELLKNLTKEKFIRANPKVRDFDEMMHNFYYWTPIEPDSVNKQIIWCLSHDLSFETEIPFSFTPYQGIKK